MRGKKLQNVLVKRQKVNELVNSRSPLQPRKSEVTSHATLSSSDQIEYQFVTLTQLEELNVFISMSLCTITYTWSFSRKVRNKLIHTKFGNHNPHIKVASLNIGRFAAPTKWLAIKQMDFDVLALCEAHPKIMFSIRFIFNSQIIM